MPSLSFSLIGSSKRRAIKVGGPCSVFYLRHYRVSRKGRKPHPIRESNGASVTCQSRQCEQCFAVRYYSLRIIMKHFNYPVEVLIKGVRERPALWDKTLEIYKDREERKQAWEQIFRILEVHFDELTRQEKRVIGR